MSSTTPSTPTPEARKCSQCNRSASANPSTKLQACSRCKSAWYRNTTCQTTAWPAHKPVCKRPNYILKIALLPSHITNPPVTRTLSVPATLTFAQLHTALQIAFGWANTHAYDFAVRDPDYQEKDTEMDILDYIKKMEVFDRNGGEWDASQPREYEVRISEMGNVGGFNEPVWRIDRMHEGKRKHPRTVEKSAGEDEGVAGFG
jgi:hypothetical protein